MWGTLNVAVPSYHQLSIHGIQVINNINLALSAESKNGSALLTQGQSTGVCLAGWVSSTGLAFSMRKALYQHQLIAPTVFTMHNTHENDDAIHVCAEGAAAAKPTPLLTPAEQQHFMKLTRARRAKKIITCSKQTKSPKSNDKKKP